MGDHRTLLSRSRSVPEQPRPVPSGATTPSRSLLQKKRLWVPIALVTGFALGSGGGGESTPTAGVPASTITRTTTATARATSTATVRLTSPARTVTAAAPTVTKTVTKKAKAATSESTRVGLVNTTGSGGGTDPQFSSCRAAKAGGFGPYRQGVDPEYDWYRDADDDGIVCE